MATISKVRLVMFYTTLLLLSCLLLSSNASSSKADQVQTKWPLGVRKLLLKTELADEDDEDKPKPPPKKTKSTTTTTTISQSKPLTKSSPMSDQLSLPKSKLKKLNSTSSSPKLSSTTSSSKLSSTSSKNSTTLITSKSKKLTNSTSKATDSIKPSSLLTKKSPGSISLTSPIVNIKAKNLSPPNSTTTPKAKTITDLETDTKSKSIETKNPTNSNSKPKPTAVQKPSLLSWIDQDDEYELVSDFRNLPYKFQETLLPDLESISKTSKAYLTEANKEMTKNFKPLIGKKYASITANIVSFAFIILPLFLVSLLISRVKTYFSLQKLLVFINIYLSIYFSILSLSAVVTGLEPLRFLFATSQSTYVGIQILQTLCYVFYLLLLVMYLVLVFSTETGLGSKMLGLSQIFVGFAVGLHYYVAVFHRVVLHQPPKTNWKVHAVYATCFLVISLFAMAERRKKKYLEEGGEEGKKN
ncbi:unnamed protein product [Rhodiola kirilowii]